MTVSTKALPKVLGTTTEPYACTLKKSGPAVPFFFGLTLSSNFSVHDFLVHDFLVWTKQLNYLRISNPKLYRIPGKEAVTTALKMYKHHQDQSNLDPKWPAQTQNQEI